jgi:hypothetical protein
MTRKYLALEAALNNDESVIGNDLSGVVAVLSIAI